MNKQQGFAWVSLLIITGVIIVAGVATYTIIQNNNSKSIQTPNTTTGSQENYAENEKLNYPDIFILKSNEIPSGFQLRTLNDDANEIGFTSNPGFINNPILFEDLYENIDASTIEQLYLSVYVQPENPSTELGIFVVKYKSKQNLLRELDKMIPGNKRQYLMRDNYLVIVWSDTDNYETEMNQIANSLKTRLNLTEI